LAGSKTHAAGNTGSMVCNHVGAISLPQEKRLIALLAGNYWPRCSRILIGLAWYMAWN